MKLGGLKKGFCNVEYQVLIESKVKKEPTNPAPWHIRIKTKSLTILLDIISNSTLKDVFKKSVKEKYEGEYGLVRIFYLFFCQ